MTPIAPNLLNKIQAVKTLRDRAATDGEKDAAQHKLTILLAKHKLTEQDIPNPDFSTRGRYHRHTYEPPPRPENPSPGAGGFDPRNFEDVLRRMRWEAQQAQRRSRQQQQARRAQARDWGNPFEDEPSRGRTSNPNPNSSTRKPSGKLKSRERFEQALQAPVSNQAWRVAKNAHKRAARMDEPSNKAAYSRAFYEAAGIRLYERLTHINLYNTRSPKSKNPQGTAAGRVFGDTIDLKWFPIPPPPA